MFPKGILEVGWSHDWCDDATAAILQNTLEEVFNEDQISAMISKLVGRSNWYSFPFSSVHDSGTTGILLNSLIIPLPLRSLQTRYHYPIVLSPQQYQFVDWLQYHLDTQSTCQSSLVEMKTFSRGR
jgi:hypothetical protein